MTAHGFVVSEEKSNKLLTLIIDKKGLLGENLLRYIDKNIPCVLVTADENSSRDNIISIPFQKDIPEIPEGVYSHIFFVWEGKNETLHMLEPLLQKAAADNIQFVFVTDYHLFSEKLKDYIYQHYSQATIILLGDLFGNEQYGSVVSDMFLAAQKDKLIALNTAGLTTVYPAFFSDVVEKIGHVGFSNERKKIFLAGYSDGITQLSVAHLLQKIDPFIKIDFTNSNEQQSVLPEVTSLFSDSYPISRKLQDSFTDFVTAKQMHTTPSTFPKFSAPAVVKKQKKTTGKHHFIFVTVILLILFFLSPIVLTLFYAGLGGVLLKESLADGKKGNFSEAVTFATTGKTVFSLASQTQVVAGKELHALFLSSLSQMVDSFLMTGNTASVLLVDGFSAGESFSQVAKGLSVSPLSDFSQGVSSLQHALIILSQMPQEGSIDGIKIKDITTSVQQYASVLDLLPQLFGFPQKKTYAILLQNNMELRPGGGFIGSYAIVGIDHGKIGGISLHDVYDADGQLQGHIEPPYVIRRYIPLVHWYLRDSNFDIDFLQDAKNAAFFLKLETGQQVDGVVAIDLSFMRSVLGVIGPVYVPEYNQTVTADNLFLLTEQHAEKNTFAGSSQKKDFLRALFTALQAKTTNVKNISLKNIFALLQAVSQKHVLFGFSDTSMQAAFTANDMSSSLWDGRKTQGNELLDFSGINEANIGINKANAFVTRQVIQTMALSDTGSISGKLAITYTNNSKPNTWPGGPYKNYLRIILPLGAKIHAIAIAGHQEQIVATVTDASIYEAKGFVPPSGLEMDSNIEEGKQVYGFIVTIPVQTTQTIDMTYTLAQKIDMTQPTLTYNMELFKQPGVDGYPYTFSLTVPSGFSVLQTTGVTGTGNSISWDKTFDTDTQFSATFTHQ